MISCGGRARRNCAIVVRPEGVAGEGMALLPGGHLLVAKEKAYRCSFDLLLRQSSVAPRAASPMGANMVVRL